MGQYTDEQLKFINYNGESSVILSATAGSGKEQPLFCKILTPTGWTTMGEIKVGDEVLTPTGEVSKVTNIYPQGLKEAYKITFSDGSFTYAGKEHLWKTQTRYQRGKGSEKFNIVKTEDMMSQLYKTDSRGTKAKFWYIPLTNIEYPEKELPIDPYLLGCLLGDGGLSRDTQISFTNSDPEIVSEISRLVNEIGLNLRPKPDILHNYTISSGVKYDNQLLVKLRELGLMEHLSIEKFIPRQYLTASKSQRLRLLNGLLDTDGYPQNNSIVITLSSKKLVDDIVELVNSIGGIVYVSLKKGRYKKNGVYIECNQTYVMSICLSKETKFKAFTLPRKRDLLVDNVKTYTPYRAIDTIEYFDTVECQCIEIDHPDHLYVTDNHIVTHNTHSVVARLNKMIEDGVNPSRIILFSFTNDAVNELQSRIKYNVKISTIHSFTSSMLGKMGLFKPIVTFFDFVNWYKEKYKPHAKDPMKIKQTYARNVDRFFEEGGSISSTFSAYKLQNADGIRVPKPPFFDEYIAFLRESKSRDFSDMLIEVERLSKKAEYKHYFEGLYDYIFIDEYQDTSTLQMKILLAIKAKQYYLIGDINQCIIKGSKVLTNNGYQKIEDLKVGDLVLSGAGSNNVRYKPVIKITNNKYDGAFVELKTKSGKILTTTPKHTHFANFSYKNENKFLVYLMYKQNVGFRIGKTEIYPKRNVDNNSDRFGFKHRLNQEHANKIWILNTYSTLKDALVAEDLYSLNYGIPKCVFIARPDQNQEQINEIYEKIDTHSRAYKLLSDLFYNINQPHFVPKSIKNNNTNITIQQCVDGRSINTIHSLQVYGYNNAVKEYFESNGYVTTQSKEIGWRIRKQTNNLENLMNTITLISDTINLILKIRLNSKSYLQLPAAQVLPGMSVMIYENNEIIEDEIIEKNIIYKNETVYDINVENTHNLIVNGIFTHNAIYGFSGANCEAIENLLMEKYNVTTDFKLTRNFRSHKKIVENANKYSFLKAVANSENDGHVHSNLIDEDEMYDMMKDGKPLTILARVNSTIKEIEKQALKSKIKMRYFNFLSEQDIVKIKEHKINQSLKHKIDAVAPYYGGTHGLIKFIEENKDSNVFVTSIHKSKGREFPRCIVINSIDPGLLAESDYLDAMYTYIKENGDIDIEARNVHYVAVTRPKEELYFLVYE
jgi:intein/homing endonuclease